MKTKSIIFSVFICIIIFIGSASAQNSNTKQCLSYEPAEVNLKGKLMRKAVVNASERKETIWIVKLNAAVCVEADAGNEFNPAFERITDVQLVFNAEQLRKYRTLENQKVSLTGTLFAGHTQHHFTEVLLTVADVKKK